MQVSELLDRAKTHTGSDGETARQLEVTVQRLSDWRNARRPCPITVQARVCELAKMNEGEQMRYVWEVVRERMGKPIAGARGVAVWIASTVAAFVLLAASLGSSPAEATPSLNRGNV